MKKLICLLKICIMQLYNVYLHGLLGHVNMHVRYLTLYLTGQMKD
jgi:hypothetical protein